MRRALFLLLLSAALGCDAESLSIGAAPDGACRSAGDRCTLGDGPVGICERTTCDEGEAGPCFHCTPQH